MDRDKPLIIINFPVITNWEVDFWFHFDPPGAPNASELVDNPAAKREFFPPQVKSFQSNDQTGHALFITQSFGG